jgi:hypothetical protein
VDPVAPVAPVIPVEFKSTLTRGMLSSNMVESSIPDAVHEGKPAKLALAFDMETIRPSIMSCMVTK